MNCLHGSIFATTTNDSPLQSAILWQINTNQVKQFRAKIGRHTVAFCCHDQDFGY